ncbi:MAG TPA: PAS domain S-box protein, partial [Acidobacteriota bacterium]|nr:PAS domain S-box protein [Acidobacteriota bacterium]
MRSLRVLFLEDRQVDYEIALHELSMLEFQITALRVDSRDEYIEQLEGFNPQLIIADHTLPSYDGLSAFEDAHRICPNIPFIFVTGTLDEDLAIESLKRGATDYVIKQKLSRLRPAVERAIHAADARQKLAEAERKQREFEGLYQSLVENLPQCVYRTDDRGRFTFVNNRLCQFTGISADSILGKTFGDLYPVNEAQKFTRNDAQILEMGVILDSVEEIHSPEKDESQLIQLIKSPLRDERQNIIGIQGIFRDITETRLTETRIQHLKGLLYSIRTITGLMARERDAARLLNEACSILARTRGYKLVWIGYVRPGSKRVFPVASAGVGQDYLDQVTVRWDETPAGQGPVGKAIRTLMPSVVDDIAADLFFAPWRNAALERGYASVAALPILQGKEALGAIAVYFDKPNAFDSEEIDLLEELASDLSYAIQNIANENRRKKIEERLITESRALIDSEMRYRDLFENANDIIFTLNLNGKVTSLNKAGQRLLGLTQSQSMQLNYEEILAEEHLDLARDIFRRTIAGENLAPVEVVVLNNSHQRFTIEVSTRVMTRNGEPIGLQGIARDLTERNLLQRQLLQAQKMEAIGRLAGGISHDFNNLLTIIIGNCDFLRDTLKKPDQARRDVDQIKNAAVRAADLTAKLLAFSRKQILQPRVLDLNALIKENATLLRRMIGEDIELIISHDPSLGSVKADATQLEQIIMNLAVNAKDAMAKGGRFSIETANVELDQSFVAENPGSHMGKFVMMAASDTGIGMDAETKTHIFEPFFTTKEEGKGTGLGLATVYGIVKQSGGYI